MCDVTVVAELWTLGPCLLYIILVPLVAYKSSGYNAKLKPLPPRIRKIRR